MYSLSMRIRFRRILFVALALILTSILCVVLVGCGTAEKPKTKESRGNAEKTTTQTTAGSEQQKVPASTATNTQKPQPSGIPWDEAKYHIGERATVYGPVASTKWATSSRGQPTFINIGNSYPNTNRFTVVIWGENRGNFPFAPESHYSGKTISVTGLITSYEGIPEIEVTSPNQIQEW